jgi:ABC-2 type transport system permease protein
LREWLPTYYSNAWISALSSDIEWGDMIRGTSYSLITFTLLIGFAYYRFDRKDITS